MSASICESLNFIFGILRFFALTIIPIAIESQARIASGSFSHRLNQSRSRRSVTPPRSGPDCFPPGCR
jgi:hypothetical protein